jgi:hypothetical protein
MRGSQTRLLGIFSYMILQVTALKNVNANRVGSRLPLRLLLNIKTQGDFQAATTVQPKVALWFEGKPLVVVIKTTH